MSNEQFSTIDALIAKAAQVEGFLDSLAKGALTSTPSYVVLRSEQLKQELCDARTTARAHYGAGALRRGRTTARAHYGAGAMGERVIMDDAMFEAQVAAILAGAEMAFKCAEKGMNLQATLARIDATLRAPKQPRFKNVGCSHCGGAFGPGDAGFSHCDDHAGLPRNDRPVE